MFIPAEIWCLIRTFRTRSIRCDKIVQARVLLKRKLKTLKFNPGNNTYSNGAVSIVIFRSPYRGSSIQMLFSTTLRIFKNKKFRGSARFSGVQTIPTWVRMNKMRWEILE